MSDRTLERRIGERLREKGWTLSLAESLTGGRIASRIVEVPGASDYFAGGLIAYDNAVKTDLLGVSPETLGRFGAVSAECAREMAAGLKTLFKTAACVSVTGIAGPGGGSARKPVGLVYAGFFLNKRTAVECFRFTGDRRRILDQTARRTLEVLLAAIEFCG